MLDQVNIPQLHAAGLSGRGVTIAIFDTGFARDHECLAGVDVVAAWDFVNEDPDVHDQRDDPEGAADHGTQMLGLLAGYSAGNLIGPAYGASLILAKTEDIAGETVAEEDNWIAALEWAVGLGADVVSSSVGYYDWYAWSDLDGNTAPITVAADMAAARGTVVVVGVGDMRFEASWPHILAPADGRNVIAVGGADMHGYVHAFSSPGPTYDGRVKPDVLARAAGAVVPVPWTTDIYYFAVGTDNAVPLVAGAVALMLEQAPGLTPLQIRDALRETASRSLLPDNDYGWGLVDALAASAYWRPDFRHDPLGDQPAGTGAFPVTVTILSRLPLVADSPGIYYRVDGGDWTRTPLAAAGGNQWTGTLPPQVAGRTVEYRFAASNEAGLTTLWPDPVRQDPFRFTVGADVTPPVITHVPLTDQTASTWPPVVFAAVADDRAVDRVQLIYAIDGGPLQGPLPLQEVPGGWAVDFPIPAGAMTPGHTVSYILVATDAGAPPNVATVGPLTFAVREHLGSVLVIDDRYGGDKSVPAAAGPRGATQAVTASLSAADLVRWVDEAGYRAEKVDAENFVNADLTGRDVVLYTSGNYLAPLSFDGLRDALVAWVAGGGRILLEGGDLAYAAVGNPGAAEFRARVLHMEDLLTDDGLVLYARPDETDHPLLTRPHSLPSPLRLNVPAGVQDWGAADVVTVIPGGTVVMQTGYGAGTGGIVVHDDNTGRAAGQIVFLPFDLQYLLPQQGRALVENALAYLMAGEPGGPSAIGGRVRLAGLDDHSGVTVTAGRGITAVTAADGSFRLDGLWGGRYSVTAAKEGFSTVKETVELVEGEQELGLVLGLVPIRHVYGAAWPNLLVPDDDAAGVGSTVTVGEAGVVTEVRVEIDLTHFAIGQLVVTLTSPSGTSVTLHNRSGDLTDDLVGVWPDDLWVDGPGGLDDFAGESATGAWTLNVSDRAFGATGRLRGWALNLLVADANPAAAPQEPGGRTRILGNAPNPFNPRTSISFELARPGPVRLDIHDVRGRLVARLVDAPYPAGRHSAVWDDRKVASGVYFARLVADGRTEVHKMTLLR